MGASAMIRRVEVVANVASGSVGADAPEEIAKILADFGLAANVCAPETHELGDCLRRAVDAAPDLLVVLAGDGTARAAAELCGPDGPMLAPLPGGTMNMLPHAIFGVRPWPAARFGRRRLAWTRAKRALRQAFTGRLRYSLDAGPRQKAEALIFMCPTTSRALTDEEQVLEAAALDLKGVADVVRLGLNALVRDWRDDPAVASRRCRLARIWTSQGIPAVLDGESVRLRSATEVRYTPKVARVLSIPKDV